MVVRFDDVSDIARTLLQEFQLLGQVPIHLVRELGGALVVVVPDDALSEEDLNRLANRLHHALGKYSLGERRVLLRESDLLDQNDVLHAPDLVIDPEVEKLFMVDRLHTNQDWLHQPLCATQDIPTAVAFSIKGGVGRSTAFAVWAWYLARMGKRVMVVDLDLEAPGIGDMLQHPDRRADFGLVDWLAESLVHQADEGLLEDMLGRTVLHENIRVIPAAGSKTRNYLSKLGRAYLPTLTRDQAGFEGLSQHLQHLLKAMGRLPDQPEVILLDSRAGLHDIGAAAVTQLAGEVFLFSRHDAQSWTAYRHLFDALKQSKSIRYGGGDGDLRLRMNMVAGQLDAREEAFAKFNEASYQVWETLYDEDLYESSFSFALEADSAPHYPIPVYFHPAFRGVDFLSDKPPWEVVEDSFGRFLREATLRLFGGEN